MAKREQQIAQADSEATDRVVTVTRCRRAVPGQVGRHHRVAARQRIDHVPPILIAAPHPMDQQQYRASARLHVGHPAAVQHRRPGLHQVHRDAPSTLTVVATSTAAASAYVPSDHGATHAGDLPEAKRENY
jgi:hypothetical protein